MINDERRDLYHVLRSRSSTGEGEAEVGKGLLDLRPVLSGNDLAFFVPATWPEMNTIRPGVAVTTWVKNCRESKIPSGCMCSSVIELPTVERSRPVSRAYAAQLAGPPADATVA